jgi:hypothetical protein
MSTRNNKKSSFSFKGRVGADNKKARTGGGGGTQKYLSLPKEIQLINFDETVKKVQMDILPYIVTDKNHPDRDEQYEIAVEGSPWYKRPIRVHKDVGAKRERHICLASLGKKCPICEIQKELFDQGKKEEAVALYPQDRVIYFVIPRDSKKHDEIPYVWDMSYKMFQESLKEAIDEDEENENFPSLEDGKTLEVKFHWDTIGDKGKPFPETRHIEFLDRDALDESIMDDLPSLDDLLNVLSYKELEAKFLGEDVDEDKEEEKIERKSKEAPALRKGKFENNYDEGDEKPKKLISQKSSTKSSLTNKKVEKEEDPELPTWEELQGLTYRKLKNLTIDLDLNVDVRDFEESDIDDFRVAIAKELDIEMPKKQVKKPIKKEEPEDEALTWVDIDEMSIKQLNKLIAEKDLNIDFDAYDLTDPDVEIAFRVDIATELDIKVPGKKTTSKEPAKPAAKASKVVAEPAGKNKCPHKHVFGVDTDKFDECGKCKLWDDCDEEYTKKKKK